MLNLAKRGHVVILKPFEHCCRRTKRTLMFVTHLGRDTWLGYARGRAGSSTSINFADVLIRFVGDVAIVTGRNDMTGQSAISSDGRLAGSLRFTQVWVHHQGH